MDESSTPGKMHILLVEDNEHDRVAFRRALSASEIDCRISECQKAEEALELLQLDAQSFDLVVIDFGLPGMSGLELFKKIHEDGQHPPFMMLTGSGSEHLAVEALKSGVSDYIVKDPKHGYLQLLPVVIKEVLQKHQGRLARQRAEKALQESEEKVRRQLEEIETIYRSAGVGLCVLDKALRFIRVNERLAEMNGVPVEHHFGRTVREIVPGLADLAESLAERIFRTGEPIQDLEISGTTACQPDVQRYWIEQWNPLKDALGNVIAINIAAEEITERKRFEEQLKQANEELEARVAERTSTLAATIQALEAEIAERAATEQALSESEKQYSTLVRNSLTGIFIEQDGRIAFANERFANIYGYSKEELAGMDVLDLVHPEDRSLIREVTRKRLAGAVIPSEYDARGITKTGDTIWIQRRNTLIDYQGSPAILGNHIEITKRKQLESSLRENERKLRLLSTRILSAQEEERKRIARELHDSISSSLTAINMGLAAILEMVGGESKPAVSINNLISITCQTMDEARRMMNALRPSMLDDLGLVITIGS
ncbi:MAG: PAS domain S-box protein, partial [Desulfoferrobacter sp.]